MSNADSDLLEQYIDTLSIRELRKYFRDFVRIYRHRPASPGSADKNLARAAQKGLAENLAATDADWMLREVVLNAGRSLYYSSEPTHEYYVRGLLELFERIADKLKSPDLVKQFRSALEGYQKETEGAGNAPFASSAVLDRHRQLITIASEIVEKCLDKLGPKEFSTSERKLLTGVITPGVARRLGA